LRVGQCLGEGHNCELAVKRPCKLLSGRENDCEVDRCENVLLYAVAVSDEEIGTETRYDKGGDEVIEANKSLFELLGWVAVETCEYDGEDRGEILLDDAATNSY
jgi:hypothetical protein